MVDAGKRLALVILGLLPVATCSSSEQPNDGEQPPESAEQTANSLEPLPPPEPESPSIPNPASAAIVRQERLYQVPDPLGSLQREFGIAPVLLPPGEHVADALGIDVTLRLDRWWRLDAEELGSFTLNRPEAPVGSLLPAVVFLRPVGLAPVSRVADWDLIRGEHSIPPDDLGAWLDEVRQIDVIDRGTIEVGDRVGQWYDVDVLPDAGPLLDECTPGRCINTWWSGGTRATVARDLESLRYYSFPDPAGPIFVLVAAEDDEFDEWNRLAIELLQASEFGPSAAHPGEPGVSAGFRMAHPAGSTWRFVTFPGLTVTAERFSVSDQQPGYLVFLPWAGANFSNRASIIRPVAATDGTSLETIDDVIRLLGEAGLERLPDDTLVEGSTAVFGGVVDGPILRRAELRDGDDPDFVRWPEFLRTYIRVWVMDTPIGVLLLAAEAGAADDMPLTILYAEMLSRSIAFD